MSLMRYLSTSSSTSSNFMVIFIITHMISTIGTTTKPPSTMNNILLPPTISTKLRTDPEAIKPASQDYGNIVNRNPIAVLYPTSVSDIATLTKFVYNNNVNSQTKLYVAAKGCGHSVRGQAMVGVSGSGVVVEMMSLRRWCGGGGGVVVDGRGFFADVSGEQMWIDVLHATLAHGLSPVSWTDYLHITVGGTLSNAGISGQTFRFGPQISNVYELDVVTGKGNLVTCSKRNNSELFYAVLGGLGQFGIITRARITLEPAPKRVKWVRLLYNDFSSFTRDQELLIAFNGREESNALDYLEGSLITNQGSLNNWRSSFFPKSHFKQITSLIKQHDILYSLEVAKNYDDHTIATVDKELNELLKGLSYVPGFKFGKDVSYVEFLDRVHNQELKLQSQGLWEVHHPWLNLFIPKSRIIDFDLGVFKGILLKRNITTGPVLVYPMNRNKWDDRMSAIIPDEETFYTVGFLHSSGFNYQDYDDQNKEILSFCDKNGIRVKQYLPHYTNKENWIKHFGSKWKNFLESKEKFDPEMILSPGQRIFQ
ncbi:cytokinin dehydrogenase 3-like [Rutidosis leptorrhynchoides]|uniref:cytokinin dehydrogenase 3-like n=1 Tax=Rutidosis leptorrhynchoides TaxID=125765 RepID=UPI003A9A2743